MRLSFKCKTENQSIDQFSQTGSSNGFVASDSDGGDGGDFIWYVGSEFYECDLLFALHFLNVVVCVMVLGVFR